MPEIGTVTTTEAKEMGSGEAVRIKVARMGTATMMEVRVNGPEAAKRGLQHGRGASARTLQAEKNNAGTYFGMMEEIAGLFYCAGTITRTSIWVRIFQAIIASYGRRTHTTTPPGLCFARLQSNASGLWRLSGLRLPRSSVVRNPRHIRSTVRCPRVVTRPLSLG